MREVVSDVNGFLMGRVYMYYAVDHLLPSLRYRFVSQHFLLLLSPLSLSLLSSCSLPRHLLPFSQQQHGCQAFRGQTERNQGRELH